MFRNAVKLSGCKVTLGDGTEIQLWIEAGDDEVAVVAVDGRMMVGRATATRSRTRASAELAVWTAPERRRRGIGRALVATVTDWAQQDGIDYLVGATRVGDDVAHSFLGRVGLIASWRTDGHARRFALLVPKPATVPVAPARPQTARAA
jgi:GNAT superfamily N-acetyltransferase